MKLSDINLIVETQDDSETFEVVDRQTGTVVGKYKNKTRAINVRDKKDNENGSYRYMVRSAKDQKERL